MTDWLKLRVLRSDLPPVGEEVRAARWIVTLGDAIISEATTKDAARRQAINTLRELADLIERGAV